MEHSHSSKPNSTNETQKPSEPANNTANTQESSEVKPVKPLKIKGRYTPKSVPATEQSSGSFTSPPPFPGQTTHAASGDMNHPGYSYQPYGEQPAKLKHSGLGITSFILSIFALLVTVIGFIVIFVSIIDMSEQELLMLQDPNYIESMINGSSMPSFFISVIIGGLLMMSTAVISFIGFILGVISLFIKQRKKVFGILGTIFNGIFFFGGIVFIILSFISGFALQSI